MSTEEKIKQAAAKVFIDKGFSATRTRDIAEEAGINIASLHYYYRSKDKLFEIIIGDALRQFSSSMDEIFSSDRTLKEKIYLFVDRYIDFFRENPQIPLFIMSESHNNPEKLANFIDNERSLDRLKKQIKALIEKGEIRKIHPAHFFLNILGLTAFPFLAKPIISYKLGIEDEEYNKILEERKQLIPEMLINHLFVK